MSGRAWPAVQDCASYWARRRRLSAAERDDLKQAAGVYLWRRCLIPGAEPNDIDCTWVVRH